jgi:hypothetical protein
MLKRISLSSVVVILSFAAFFGTVGAPAKDSRCALILDTLKTIQELRSGSTRAQLEQKFEADGGVQFPANSRYVLKMCPYIKIDVEFQGDRIQDRTTLLPADKIVKISKPYLEYPSSD